MDLRLSEEQHALALRAEALGRELAGVPELRDRLQGLGSSGILGLGLPTDLGGRRGDFVSLALVSKALAQNDGSLALSFLAQRMLCCEHLLRRGTTEQQHAWVPALASGTSVGCWAPAASDLEAAGGVSFVEIRSGTWTLEGSAGPVPNALAADLAVVVATLGSDPDGHVASAFLVERSDSGARFEPWPAHGMSHSAQGGIILERCQVDSSRFLAPMGGASVEAEAIQVGASICTAALAVGLGRRALSEALTRLRRSRTQRGARGREPAQGRLADAATELDAAWLLTLRAASEADGPSLQRLAGISHLTSVRAATDAGAFALQVLGPSALEPRSACERVAADLRHCETWAGGLDAQRFWVAESLIQS
jgi:hypothetical protein